MDRLKKVLEAFIDDVSDYTIETFGSGLIHHTYLVKRGDENAFILQEVNNAVFKWPEKIAENTGLLSDWLKKSGSSTVLPVPIKTKDRQHFFKNESVYYRLIPYVKNSQAINVCNTPEEAYEAAKQFGNFTASFNGFKVESLHETIMGFHDLSFRWKQFREALTNGNPDRIKASVQYISVLEDDYDIVAFYQKILHAQSFASRVTHHDTKISNVLFNQQRKGICVIDLDTVMPGFFISDLGDMFRTYLSPANEEEKDMQLVEARKDFYQAIIEGYKEKMADQMSSDEINHLNYAGEFMIYMQALRFLTDYLNNDVYYNTSYPENNLNRTINQLALLKSFRGVAAK